MVRIVWESRKPDTDELLLPRGTRTPARLFEHWSSGRGLDQNIRNVHGGTESDFYPLQFLLATESSCLICSLDIFYPYDSPQLLRGLGLTISILLGLCLFSRNSSSHGDLPVQQCRTPPTEASRERFSRDARGLRSRSHSVVRVLWSAILILTWAGLPSSPTSNIAARKNDTDRQGVDPIYCPAHVVRGSTRGSRSLTLAPVIHQAVLGASYGIIEAVQSAFLSPDLTDVMSLFYGLHFPLVIGAAILLGYSNKVLHKRHVYSLVACSYVSLVFYALAPSAPPWYNGVVSNLLATTSAQIGSSSLFLELSKIGSLIESDKLAAFPSLHAAYVVLFSYFTVNLKKMYGLVSIPITIGVLFSTTYLGQHYITDLVAGVVVATSCILIVTRLDRKRNLGVDPLTGKL